MLVEVDDDDFTTILTGTTPNEKLEQKEKPEKKEKKKSFFAKKKLSFVKQNPPVTEASVTKEPKEEQEKETSPFMSAPVEKFPQTNLSASEKKPLPTPPPKTTVKKNELTKSNKPPAPSKPKPERGNKPPPPKKPKPQRKPTIKNINTQEKASKFEDAPDLFEEEKKILPPKTETTLKQPQRRQSEGVIKEGEDVLFFSILSKSGTDLVEPKTQNNEQNVKHEKQEPSPLIQTTSSKKFESPGTPKSAQTPKSSKFANADTIIIQPEELKKKPSVWEMKDSEINPDEVEISGPMDFKHLVHVSAGTDSEGISKLQNQVNEEKDVLLPNKSKPDTKKQLPTPKQPVQTPVKPISVIPSVKPVKLNISEPTNVTHDMHAGLDTNNAIGLSGLPKEWEEIWLKNLEDERTKLMEQKENERNKGKFKFEYNVLILGSSESGKSTILNHIRMCSGISDKLNGRIFYSNPKDDLTFEGKELLVYKRFIDENVFNTTVACLKVIKENGSEFIYPDNAVFAEKLLVEKFSLFDDGSFTEKLVKSLSLIWKEPIMKETLFNSQDVDFCISDGVKFLVQPENILRYSSRHPELIQEDVLHVYRKTNVLSRTKFEFDDSTIQFFDVDGKVFNQISKSEKLISKSNGKLVIYVISLSEYNQASTSNEKKTKFQDSLALFEKLTTMKCLQDIPWLIIFNKSDMFQEKIDRFGLKFYFNDFDEDIEKPIEYITRQYLSKVKHLDHEYDIISAFEQNSIVKVIKRMEEKLKLDSF
eukprot:gene4540-7917_t